MHRIYLLTGSNMGDRTEHLQFAKKQIENSCGKLLHSSSVYETEPWGVSDQQAYLNQALFIESLFSAKELFYELKKIEMAAGRISQKKYAPRTLDIDILFFDDLILEERGITIPHPRLHLRRFVLAPMNEIAPSLLHPVFNKNILELYLECTDMLAVNILTT